VTVALLIDASVAALDALVPATKGNLVYALYADFGEQAASLGPWLIPADSALRLHELPLPQRHGVSVVNSEVSFEALKEHFVSVRTATMTDGQRFHLRLADTRALTAMMKAWPARLLARIKGPITEWNWIDCLGQPQSFAPEVSGVRGSLPLVTLDQFDAVVQAGRADALAADLEALNEAGLRPCHDAAQFQHVPAAVQWCDDRRIGSWTLRRAIARQAVLSDGGALNDGRFSAAVDEARHLGDCAPVDAWQAAIRRG
jgi:hypothetical protein